MATNENDITVDAFERLGEIQPIHDKSSVDELNNALNAHRAALEQVRGDAQRFDERLKRILPEGKDALERAQKANGAVWVPGGTDGDVYARYLNADGSVRLGRTSVRYTLPDGTSDTVTREGLFTEAYPVTPAAQRVRTAYMRYAVAHRYASKLTRGNPWSRGFVRKAYRQLRDACVAMPGPVGKFLRDVFENPQRAINNTSAVGAELINQPTIGDVRRPTDLMRRLPGLFRNYDVPSSTFKQPVISGFPLATKRGKTNTNDPAAYPVSTFATSDETLTVVDRVIMALVDPTWIEDNGNVLPDPIGVIMDWLEMGDVDSLSIAIMHGDSAGTHQDTVASWTLGGRYSAGALDGDAAAPKFWKGLRARAFDDSATVAGGGTMAIDKHAAALDAMGALAEGAVILTGLHGYYTQFVGSSELASYNDLGDRATLLTGEVASYAGKPVIIEQLIPNDLASTGLYTGSGATTTAVYVNPSRGVLATHSGGQDDFDAMYPERGARYLGMVRRSLFFFDCLSTEVPAAAIINL